MTHPDNSTPKEGAAKEWPVPNCLCGHEYADHSPGGEVCMLEVCRCVIFTPEPFLYVPRAEHESVVEQLHRCDEIALDYARERDSIKKSYASLKAVADRMADELQRLKDVIGEVDIEIVEEVLAAYRALELKGKQHGKD